MCLRAVGFRWQDMENNHLRLYFQVCLLPNKPVAKKCRMSYSGAFHHVACTSFMVSVLCVNAQALCVWGHKYSLCLAVSEADMARSMKHYMHIVVFHGTCI